MPIRPIFALCLFAGCAMLVQPLPSWAADPRSPQAQAPERGTGILSLLPPTATSAHTITLAGKPVRYQATAGTLPLRDGSGTTTAAMFYTAYTADPASHERPVTFVFNGGPGAASAYLNLGGLGPRILSLAGDGTIPSPPARLADNPDSWLSFTDLVFVDPVGTGYSRAADPKDEEHFWGVKQDESAMAAFIRLYLERAGRMSSPVFLAGESYGGFRAALLARTLQQESGIGPSGVILISPALEFSFLYGDDDAAILPTALTLPSLAAARMERAGLSGADLARRLADVEHFATSDYLADLAAGRGAVPDRAVEQVADATGLSPDLVRRNFARISASVFIKEAGRATGTVLSRYDATVPGPDPDPASNAARGPDPVLDRTVPLWTSAMVDSLHTELGYATDVSYRLLNREISGRWDYGSTAQNQGYAGVMDDLQRARVLNPRLGVLVANGRTDLVTPYLLSRYLVAQQPVLAGAQPIVIRVYEGGHMLYTRPASRRALARDAEALVAGTLKP